ncbi:biotin-dependent carboxyltransferase family protein [uncultured Winogradskyella sp.]|uniref:5-oxoprolinase subunit C family protein n=1 Tax=uncultured Winogradskyella sp. TaxID=395353 RepID=UPI00351772B7
MLKVLESGFWTSIQDRGRYDYRGYGVPVSGWMDSYSAEFANIILGNKEGTALMELTMTGPSLQFDSPTSIAIVGADMQPSIHGTPVLHNKVIDIKANDILKFHAAKIGVRCYLAIKEGFKSETVLGSRSFYEGITEQARIKKGDVIPYQTATKSMSPPLAKLKFKDDYFHQSLLEVFPGPDYDMLSQELKNELRNTEFKISGLNNRMAYQFENLISNSLDNMITGPVIPGTVQLTPSGRLIALMKDCQTTGGYPRVLQLTQKAMNALSQKAAGKSVNFRLKGFNCKNNNI